MARRSMALMVITVVLTILGVGTADADIYAPITNGYGNHLCLDAKNDSGGNPANNGDPVQLWSCNGGYNQNWAFTTLVGSDGYHTWWTITNGWPSLHLCLDAKNDSSGNPSTPGDRVQLWSCNGGWNQQWAWNGRGLMNRGGGLCLDAKNDSAGNPNNNGDPIQLWSCSGAANQDWWD